MDAAIDRWVWYAGWADKFSQVVGSVNPVNGSYFNFTVPEATGVVGVIAPEDSSLLGLVSRLAPVIVSGNAAVVVASESRPLPAVTLTEVLATSDVPGGVVNLVTGLRREIVPTLAAHMDVNALDAFGVATSEAAAVEESGVENVKRVIRPPRDGLERYDWLDASARSRRTSSANTSRQRRSGTPSGRRRWWGRAFTRGCALPHGQLSVNAARGPSAFRRRGSSRASR